MHAIYQKYVEKILRAKKEALSDLRNHKLAKPRVNFNCQKNLFQTSTRLLFWHVEFFLHIFDKCYAYEKQSLGSKESLSTTKSIIRHVEMIIRQERAIFVGFKEIIS